MSRAKALIERMCPMPVITPEPGTKPGTAPSPRPVQPKENPNPFRRGKVRPGQQPRPKARNESVSRALIEGGAHGSQIGSTSRGLIEDSDFVERMKAAREAKKSGGKAPDKDGMEGKGKTKELASAPSKKGNEPVSKSGSAESGEAVKHAFNK